MTWLTGLCAIHEHSDRPAIIGDLNSVTGRELIGKAVAAAETLVDIDAETGRPIPALLTANADSLAMLFGGIATNRPLAPLGPRQTASELADAVRRCRSSVLLADHGFAETAGKVAELTDVHVKWVPTLPVSSQALHIEAGDVALYLHTAGTTGVPKRVAITEQVLMNRAEILRQLTNIGPDDRYATGSPLHHMAGLGAILVALTAGAAVIPTPAFTFDWWRNLQNFGATHCLLVPTMIEMLLAKGILDVVRLKTLVYGASPIAVGTLRRVLEVLPDVDVVSLYGQTEGSPITSLSPHDHRIAAAADPDVLHTVGRPVSGLRLRIDSPDRHGVGELLADAAHLSVTDAHGWLHTGDLGVVDANGYVRLCGRRHDMVVRGGENVYPLEVENALSLHPSVASVGVVGVPDGRLGETLAAFVIPNDAAAQPSFEELSAFTRSTLAGFKVPQYWYSVAELPLSSAGKVLRTQLRAWHLERRAAQGRGGTE